MLLTNFQSLNWKTIDFMSHFLLCLNKVQCTGNYAEILEHFYALNPYRPVMLSVTHVFC